MLHFPGIYYDHINYFPQLEFISIIAIALDLISLFSESSIMLSVLIHTLYTFGQ